MHPTMELCSNALLGSMLLQKSFVIVAAPSSKQQQRPRLSQSVGGAPEPQAESDGATRVVWQSEGGCPDAVVPALNSKGRRELKEARWWRKKAEEKVDHLVLQLWELHKVRPVAKPSAVITRVMTDLQKETFLQSRAFEYVLMLETQLAAAAKVPARQMRSKGM